MPPSSEVQFTPREVAVLAEVLLRVPLPSFTVEDWRSIATNAGITDGDTARNAKYSLAQVKKKLGVQEGGGKAAGKRKKEQADEEGEVAKKPKKKEAAKEVKDEWDE